MDEDLLAPSVGAGWAGVFEGARVVASGGTWQLGTDQVVELLRAQAVAVAQLEAGRLALLRELDDRGWAAQVGATSTAVWLSQALLVDRRVAVADVRAARALDPEGDVPPEPGTALSSAAADPGVPVLAATGRALAAGVVSRAHADALTRAVADLPPGTGPGAGDVRARAEVFLLGQCQERTPSEVRGMGRYLLSVVDPDGVLADCRDHSARDEAGLLVDHTGRGVFRASLNPVDTALLCALLDAGSTPRPLTGDGPDRRTPAQRRAGAFTDLIRLAAAAGPTTSGSLPTTLVITTTLESLVTGHPALVATTERGTRIDAGTLRALACDASIIPAVLGSASEPLDIGRATRSVPPALRRALVLRDRHCAFPGCDRPPRWCDAHHIHTTSTPHPTTSAPHPNAA